MLRQQVWMADDDEFGYIVKNSQRVLGLSIQYENHRYVEEFAKQCNVMFIYVGLRRGDRFKFFLERYMEFISGAKKHKQFLQTNYKLYESMELPTKYIRSSTEHRDHQANT